MICPSDNRQWHVSCRITCVDIDLAESHWQPFVGIALLQPLPRCLTEASSEHWLNEPETPWSCNASWTRWTTEHFFRCCPEVQCHVIQRLSGSGQAVYRSIVCGWNCAACQSTVSAYIHTIRSMALVTESRENMPLFIKHCRRMPVSSFFLHNARQDILIQFIEGITRKIPFASLRRDLLRNLDFQKYDCADLTEINIVIYPNLDPCHYFQARLLMKKVHFNVWNIQHDLIYAL